MRRLWMDDSLAQEKQEQAVLDMQDILEADGKYKQVHIDDSFFHGKNNGGRYCKSRGPF